MKVKKIIMVFLFVLGGLELLVGVGAGFYPSLILGSCLLYGAVTLKNRIKIQSPRAIAASSKVHRLPWKDCVLPVALMFFACMFLCSSLMTGAFPGLAVGVLFGFFSIKNLVHTLKKRSDYHADDSKTIC